MIPVAAYWTQRRKELLRTERGTQYKVNVTINCALCYPNSYFIGMSNLGFQTAYHVLNLPEDSRAERAFFESHAVPVTLESGCPIGEFPFIGFSIGFELDYINFLHMLSLAKIPLLRKDRSNAYPIVFVGGFTTFFNPKPLLPFVDFIVLGESEESMPRVIDVLRHYQIDRNMSKDELLRNLSCLKGVFVPDYSGVVEPLYVNDLNSFETITRILTTETEFSDMFLIEIARGCFNKCNFCLSGHVYGRPRIRDISSIKESCEKGLRLTNRLGLIASAPSDYPHIDELCEYLIKKDARISFSSLRINTITKQLLTLLRKSGQTTLTLAPETGSERLRKHINKSASDKHIFDVVQAAKAEGFRTLRTYIMIGLPGETEDDIRQTADLLKEIAALLPVRASVSVFIPKPKTPFADCSVIDKKTIREKMKYLKNKLKQYKRITLKFDGISATMLQAELAKGDETALLDGAAELSAV